MTKHKFNPNDKKTKYYCFEVDNGTPFIHGPFKTYKLRDKKAKKVNIDGQDNFDPIIIFWMDIDSNGIINVGEFIDGDLD